MNLAKTELTAAARANTARKFSMVVCLLGLAGMGGCGESPEGAGKQLPTVRVSGTVTYKGSPVDDATVSFHPSKPGDPGPFAKTNSEGEFTLRTYKAGDGAPEGDYVVTVQKSEVAPAEQKSGPDMFKEMEKQALAGKKTAEERPLSLIPEKYARTQTSGLSATVKSGDTNKFDFELKD